MRILLLMKRTVKNSASHSLSLTSIFSSIKFTFIFHFIPLIYSQYSRSRPLNNRCPENWFVTLYLRTYTYAYFLLLSFSLTSSVHPTWRSIHATICLVEPAPSTSSLRVTSSAADVSADICFIVFHVLFEINNTPASVPFFSYFIRRERGAGGSSLHSISHTRACLSQVQREWYYMFSTILDKQSVKYLERLFLSSFD